MEAERERSSSEWGQADLYAAEVAYLKTGGGRTAKGFVGYRQVVRSHRRVRREVIVVATRRLSEEGARKAQL